MSGPKGAPAAHLSEIFVSTQGEGSKAGQRHLFVRFAGCNIRCRYCDTPDSLSRVPSCRIDYCDGRRHCMPNPVEADALRAILERMCGDDPGIRMISLTGGEPTLQGDFLAALLEHGQLPRPVLLETNAVCIEGLAHFLPLIDVVSADVKLPSNSGERAFWTEHRAFFRACREAGCREVYVKMPVDADTDADEVVRGARIVAEALPGATLFLQPIHEPDRAYDAFDSPALHALVARASLEVDDVRLMPQMHKLMGVR